MRLYFIFKLAPTKKMGATLSVAMDRLFGLLFGVAWQIGWWSRKSFSRFEDAVAAATRSPHPAATDFLPNAKTIRGKRQTQELRDRRMRSPALKMSALPNPLSPRAIIIFLMVK